MSLITTRYYPPTTCLRGRVKAMCAAGKLFMDWDAYINVEANHLEAAQILADEVGWRRPDHGKPMSELGTEFIFSTLAS